MRNALALCLMLAACAPAQPKSDASADAAQENAASDARRDPRCAGKVALSGPAGDVIADKQVAERLALIYFAHRFPGAARNERPLDIQRRQGVWYVSETIEQGAAGGGMNIELCSANGRVLALYATQ